MSWFLRLLGWAAVLAVPCWLLSPLWQRGLAAALNPVLVACGLPGTWSRVDVGAPFDIGLFAALCLSSRRAPKAERMRALALGIPCMVALELIVVGSALAIVASRPNNADPLLRAGFYLADTVPWMGGPLLWLLWLGGWELPRAGVARRP